MDKNAIALLREDTYTVGVRFFRPPKAEMNPNFKLLTMDDEIHTDLSQKLYTYVTNIPGIKKGDHVIVEVTGYPILVLVCQVDDNCNISPNDTKEYKWIRAKVDYTGFNKMMEENEKLLEVISKAYKKNLKRSFRDLILAGMGDEEKLLLSDILEQKK